MKKDFNFDYSVSAFVFYAHNGRSVEEYKSNLYKKCVNESKYINISPLFLYERELDNNSAALLDILSVESVLQQLQLEGDYETITSLDMVYFSLPSDYKKGDIYPLIIKASLYIPSSERSVQRYLSKARKMFAVERGLRI